MKKPKSGCRGCCKFNGCRQNAPATWLSIMGKN